MKIKNILNPAYIYKRRDRIVPYFQERTSNVTQGVQRYIAMQYLSITGNDRKLAALKDKHKGKRCFVLGNGPSLKNQDLSLLRNEFVFVTNWFVLHDEFPNLHNCFLCISDPHLWNFGKGFHVQLLDKLVINPNVLCFFEKSALFPLNRQNKVNKKRVKFIRVDESKKVWEGNFSSDVALGTCWGFTVIMDICLPLAFFLGFDIVYLMGCDCDYKLKEDKDFSKSFFYNISKIPESDLSHIAKQRDEANAQEQLDKWIAGYQVVKSYFEDADKRIFNAGHGGKLEVFERVNYQNLF